jgi:hypothetical protein
MWSYLFYFSKFSEMVDYRFLLDRTKVPHYKLTVIVSSLGTIYITKEP